MYTRHLHFTIVIFIFALSNSFANEFPITSSYQDTPVQRAGASPVFYSPSLDAELFDGDCHGVIFSQCQTTQQQHQPLPGVAIGREGQHLTQASISRPNTSASCTSLKKNSSTSLAAPLPTSPTQWAISLSTGDFAATTRITLFGHKPSSFVSLLQSPKRSSTKPLSIMGTFKDLTGQKFGRLTVVSRAENYKSPSGKTYKTIYNCICDCGNKASVKSQNLLSGGSKSCGCLMKDFAKKGTHHMSRTRFYRIYSGIIERCYNTKNHAYQYYGGRGIKVSDDWLSFDGFAKDMFPTYKDGLSIERLDPNKNYEAGNCKWIPLTEQNLNKRNTRWITFMGETLPLALIAKKYEIDIRLLWKRLKRGWSVEDAIEKPVKQFKPCQC